jgi:lipopolysaccharide assembly outer membrane protein LptD (OstA)
VRSLVRRSLTGIALFVTCAGAAAPATTATPVPAAASAASAAPSSAPDASSLDSAFYRIETDTIVTQRNGDFAMPHKVALSRPGSDGTADSAKGNDKRGTVTLTGNVVMHDNGTAPEAGQDNAYSGGGPATLTCDSLDVDSKARIYVAVGHVHFVQGTRSAVADKGTLNRQSGTLRLEGHVKTVDGLSSLTAQVMDYNLNSKNMEAHGGGGPIIIKQPVPSPEPGSGTPTPKPKKRRLPF